MLTHGNHFGRRQIGIEVVNDTSEVTGNQRGVLRGPNIKDGTKGEVLAQRNIEERFGRFAEAAVLRHSGDTYYAEPFVFQLKAFANGVLAAPVLLDHFFVHDGDGWRGFAIGV